MATSFKIPVRKLTANLLSSIENNMFSRATQLEEYFCIRRQAQINFLKSIKYFVIIFSGVLFANSVRAQVSIAGTVTDKYQHPVPGASVYIKGLANGVSTDSSGHFLFSPGVKGAQALMVSSIGFKDAEKTVQLKRYCRSPG